ncbi:hypothetical protein B0H65DRAFT_112879 [Neurospora tetraspora]|uniref:Uncharacterized protein n=1 Tax=Neurospora tetraspora TaxID=94610 RepID=A0AAE0JKV2_9PEZI|nr:hypothetical protein B0H65DRAFT_112879 [Neurospora tetraspora]
MHIWPLAVFPLSHSVTSSDLHPCQYLDEEIKHHTIFAGAHFVCGGWMRLGEWEWTPRNFQMKRRKERFKL